MIKSIVFNTNKTLKFLNKSTLVSSNKNSNILNNININNNNNNNKYYCQWNKYNQNYQNNKNQNNNNNNNNSLNYSTKNPTTTTATTTTTTTTTTNSINSTNSTNEKFKNYNKINFNIGKNQEEEYKVESILKGIEEYPNSAFYYYFLYTKLLEMKESSIKLLDGKEVDLKYLLIKTIEYQENQPNADLEFISYNYYELCNLLKGFLNETIDIKGKSLNKLDLVLLSLDKDNTNTFSLEMIQNYMIAYGVQSISLLNGVGEINFKKNMNKKLFVPKKISISTKKKLIKIIEKNENKYIVEDSLFKLVSAMRNNEKVELLGDTLDKIDIAKRLMQTHGVICNKLSNAYLVTYLILNELNQDSFQSPIDGSEITQKQLLISHIERTPNNLQFPSMDTNYFSYYILSTLLDGFTNDFVVINGKKLNKIDLILKAYDINEASESCKKNLELYLYGYGIDSLKLLNGKTASLDQNKELQIV
ncbi:hypothetical protein ACTFIW_010127 [Dictyostelium discoideum]